MAKKFTVSARLEAEDAASGPVGRVRGAFAGLREEISSRFVITAGDVVGAAVKIAGAVGDMFRAAAEAERGQNALTAALEKQGAATPAVTNALNAQAAAIAKTTALQDDQVTSAQALLATMGVQAAQIPLATQAAVDLAAALGIDLNTAARQVGATFNGVTGRLAAVAPELANLTAEELAAGEGARILAEQLAGAATAASADFASQLQGLQNDVGELGEAFALGITGTTNFDAAVAKLRVTVQEAQPAFEVFGQVVGGFFSVLNTVGKGLGESAARLVEFATANTEAVAAANPFLAALTRGAEVLGIFAPQAANAAEATTVQGEAAASAAAGVQSHGDAAADAAAKIAQNTAATGAAASTLTTYNAALAAAGVTVVDSAAKQAQLGNAVAAADAALRAGTITQAQYDATIAAVNVKLAELAGTQATAAETAYATAAAFDAQATSLQGVATAADSAGVAIGRLEGRGSTVASSGAIGKGLSQEEIIALDRFRLGLPTLRGQESGRVGLSTGSISASAFRVATNPDGSRRITR